MLRATVNAIQDAVKKDGHIFMVDAKYREFLKSTIPGERNELKSAATAITSAEYEAREEVTEAEDPAISSAELEAREEPPSVPSVTAAELKEWEEEEDAPTEQDPATFVTSQE